MPWIVRMGMFFSYSSKIRFAKLISFILLFSIVFVGLQRIIHYRWCKNEDLYSRYWDYEKNNVGMIDVVAIGTSELYAAYDPIITYHERGITGYNLAISYKSAITQYYQTIYALKNQSPKIVICDFSSLFEDSLPDNNEQIYRKVVDTMPDSKIKQQLIWDIVSIGEGQSILFWECPMLRYHSMWNELNESNFDKDYIMSNTYNSFSKGALLRKKEYDKTYYSPELESKDITDTLWHFEESNEQFSDISVMYYDKLIAACKKAGAKVIAVIPPKLNQASLFASRWEQEKNYFESRGIEYLNYNTYEQYKRIGLVLEEDYYNAAHLNVFGSIKFSKVLAEDIDSLYKLEDKRAQSQIASMWDEEYKEFEKEYLGTDG